MVLRRPQTGVDGDSSGGSAFRAVALPIALLAGMAGAKDAVASTTVADSNGITWSCENDVDDLDGDGLPETTYNDTSVYAFSGIPGAESTRSVMDGSILETEFSLNGTDFTGLRSQVEAFDANAATSSIGVTGYASTWDQATLRVSGSSLYLLEDYSTGTWTLSDLGAEFAGSYGSVDNGPEGEIAVNDARGAGNDITEWISDTPLYDESGDQAYPVLDRAGNRLGLYESRNFYLVNDLAGAQSKDLLVSGAFPTQYLDSVDSPLGRSTFIYVTNSSHATPYQAFYCVDVTDSDGDGVLDADDAYPDDPTRSVLEVDNDGDGSSAAEDCDDNNADRYPGNTVVEDDGADNNCELDAPSVGEVSINGLSVYPMFTSSPINVAVGVAVPLIASGMDDETLSSDMTYQWTIQSPDGSTQILTGASTSFTPDQDGQYTVSIQIVDSDGAVVSDTGNFTANFSASELPEGPLPEGTEIYEDPTDTEGSDSATVHGGTAYVDESGNIHLANPGDGVSTYGVDLDIVSDISNVSMETGNETHADVILAGVDYREFAPPPSGSSFGEYADSENSVQLTEAVLYSGDLSVVSTNTWEGDNGVPELNVTLDTPGDYWLGDTVDNDEGPVDTGGGDSGDSGETGTPDTDTDNGQDSDTTPDNDDTGVNNPGGPDCGCATGADGSMWFGPALLAGAALTGRRRRSRLK